MSRASRRIVAWLSVAAISAGLLIGGGVWLSNTFRDALAPGLSLGCTATVGETSYRLALDQSQNAALIAAVAVQRGMPARAASIALATALQESKLRNIDYGDLDSVGLFQQRPSQDWGTVEQIMDPLYSANAFYDVLAKVPGYVDMSINDAAQIVQRSGYPHAYAQHETLSRAFASALTGQTPQALNCTLPPATVASTPEAMAAAMASVMGQVPFTTAAAADGSVSVLMDVDDAAGWTTAHWLLANAEQFGISQISYAGKMWDRTANEGGHNVGWQAVSAADPGQLSVVMTAAPPVNQ
ncbi:hypothetical protein [Arthrobacter glacialis]|uniref:Heavy metal transporter n=1 Tax=Arthrobacter glacialis TaxID=1664 RepID=A0A2S3ZSK9_ARTGL|nr:hypothetical protein [Arthrobacter glacialis]POH72241.1 hypothetical protein CVS27_16270 [Arthrobacter glacialis]